MIRDTGRSLFLMWMVIFGDLLPGMALAAHRVAILIGHNQGGSSENELRYATRDAQKLREVLVELGQFDSQYTLLLQDPDVRAVRDALQQIAWHLQNQKDPDTLFLFFYSGHADQQNLKLGTERLAISELKSLVASSPARIRIVVLDSCRSGTITREKGGSRGPAFDVVLEGKLDAVGQVFISSSSVNEVAQESEELKGSFFTHYLVSGLRGDADGSNDGLVTLGEAYAYSYHHTVEGTSETRAGSQHPTYRFDIAGSSDVVLTNLTKATAFLRFPKSAVGEFLVWDRKRRSVIAEVFIPGGTARKIAVRPGKYLVKRRQEDHVELAEVTIDQGQEAELDLTTMRRVPFSEDETKGGSEERWALSVGARLGYQHFLDEQTRTDLIAPLMLYGIEVSFRRIIGQFDLKADFTFSRRGQGYRILEQEISGTLNEFNLGVSLPVEFRWGAFSAQIGPRLGALVLLREFPQADYSQKYFTLSPGGIVIVGVRLWEQLLVEAEFRFSYLYLKMDAEARNLAYIESFLSLSWQFVE